MLPPILHGAFLGLSVAAPFGPVSLLCVQRSLMGRPYLGFVSGLGAATAHGTFASVAIGSADIIANALVEWRAPVHLVSAAILIALGVRTLWKQSAKDGAPPIESPHAAYLCGLMLALSNPMTILPYLAIASAITTEAIGPVSSAFLMVPGVMFGATCWYAALSSGASVLRRGVARAVTGHLNAGAGIALIGFGVIVGLE